MKKFWKIKDIIDLEYFFHIDEHNGNEVQEKNLAQRDRKIWLEHIQPLESKAQPVSQTETIMLWLKYRRDMEKNLQGAEPVLPGDVFDEIYRLLIYVFMISGCMTGAGLAFSFLTYTGTAPLNVSVYLGGLVFTQLILLTFLGIFFMICLVNHSFLSKSIIFTLTGRLAAWLAVKLKKHAMTRLSGKQRSSIQAAFGIVKGKKQVYNSLFYWPVFILAQIFGIGFNLGAVCATLLRILGTDIAFGWQSTVQVSAQFVFDMTRIMAMPWSWFVRPDIAHPSLAQIQGSHMILKDGIYHLATKDLVSWWPFLCFALVFYGLIPRVLLLITGLSACYRKLSHVDLSHNECDKLMNRMLMPLISTKGNPSISNPDSGIDNQKTNLSLSDCKTGISNNNLIALIPDDIFKSFQDEELHEIIQKTLNSRVLKKIRIGCDYKEDKSVITGFSQNNDSISGVLILQEAWQPPIKENLIFIQELRQALGEKSRIILGLIGKPEPNTIFTQVNETDWKTWKQKINTLGDPYLGIERLVI